MRVRNAFLAFAATGAMFSATLAGISPAAARTADIVEVAYSDLNLASHAGQRTLDSRIAAAVDQVCNAGEALDLRTDAQERACRSEVGAAAQAQRDAAVAGNRRGIVRVSAAAN